MHLRPWSCVSINVRQNTSLFPCFCSLVNMTPTSCEMSNWETQAVVGIIHFCHSKIKNVLKPSIYKYHWVMEVIRENSYDISESSYPNIIYNLIENILFIVFPWLLISNITLNYILTFLFVSYENVCLLISFHIS